MYKITRIGERGSNNVEVIHSKLVTDTNGVEFEIWDETTRKSYGQDVIDSERKAHAKKDKELKSYDIIKETKNLKAKEDLLDEIEVKLKE